MMKTALITGVTGQDGSFLAEFLLEKGYEVHGTIRRSSVDYRERIAHLEGLPHFHLHYADMGDRWSARFVLMKFIIWPLRAMFKFRSIRLSLLPMSMLQVYCVCLKPSAFVDWPLPAVFIRLQPLNFMVRLRKCLRMRTPLSIRIVPMPWLNFMVIGS